MLSALLQWHETARGLVAAEATPPPVASRVYALLATAQLQALQAEGSRDPVRHAAAVCATSHQMLRHLYPGRAGQTGLQARRELDWLGGFGTQAAAAQAGRQAADEVAAAAADDSADAVWQGQLPSGAGVWRSSVQPPAPPLLPAWGQVRTWYLSHPAEAPVPTPPRYGSVEFEAAVTRVRQVTEQLTDEQRHIARLWADGLGTETPPGHWNRIACELLADQRPELQAQEAAGLLATMNRAVMDAGIACWHAKFTHWLLRPSHADPAVQMVVGLPNFPSYPSGHSSFSGAASAVLAHWFPQQARQLQGWAADAAASRLYGGIHYEFDNDAGLMQGRAVGELAVSTDGAG